MTTASSADLLVLHAVRLKGMADDRDAAKRFGLDVPAVAELLCDFEAYGWVTRVDFAGTGGWALTSAGRSHNEQQLADELAAAGARDIVAEVHRDFLPSNALLQRACTDWQLHPNGSDPLAPNQHDDREWDTRVLDDLERVGTALSGLEPRLTAVLSRFAGYHPRFAAALTQAHAGDGSWVAGVGKDSCHTVWMELHEDLIATQGLERGA